MMEFEYIFEDVVVTERNAPRYFLNGEEVDIWSEEYVKYHSRSIIEYIREKLLEYERAGIDPFSEIVGKKAEKNMMGMQDGDVVATYANIDALVEAVGFKPATPLKEGMQKFVDWYKEYHGYK